MEEILSSIYDLLDPDLDPESKRKWMFPIDTGGGSLRWVTVQKLDATAVHSFGWDPTLQTDVQDGWRIAACGPHRMITRLCRSLLETVERQANVAFPHVTGVPIAILECIQNPLRRMRVHLKFLSLHVGWRGYEFQCFCCSLEPVLLQPWPYATEYGSQYTREYASQYAMVSKSALQPFSETQRRVLPVGLVDCFTAIFRTSRSSHEFFWLRDISAPTRTPHSKSNYIEYFVGLNSMGSVDLVTHDGSLAELLPTDSTRYEMIYQHQQEDNLPTVVLRLRVSHTPMILAIFWDRATLQYLQLVLLAYTNNTQLHLLHHDQILTDESRAPFAWQCILQSVAIHPLTPLLIWEHRLKKQKELGWELGSNPSDSPFPREIWTLILSFVF